MSEPASRPTARAAGAARGARGRWELPIVLAATTLGGLLRVALALQSEVWLDEANSVLLALAGPSGLAEALRLDSSPPLYYLLLWGWIELASAAPLALRVPSLLAGIAAIPLAWAAGRRLDRAATGVVAALLLAVHPLHVHYSEEIRMYALVVLLALGFHAVLFAEPRRGAALWIAGLGAALAWTHYYGLVYVGIALGWRWASEPRARRAVAWAGLGTALLFAPCLPIFLAQLASPHHVGWIAPFWERDPGGFAVLRSLQAFLPGGMKYEFLPLAGLPWQGAVLLVALFPVVAWAVGRGAAAVPRVTRDGALVLLATLAVLVAWSYATWPIYLAGRSDVVVLPAGLLAFSALVARAGRAAGPLAVILLTALALGELGRSLPALHKPGNRAIAAALDEAGCRTVLTTGLAYAPVRYYEMLEPPPSAAAVEAFPLDIAAHAGNFDLAAYAAERFERDAAELAERHAAGDGLCLLASPEPWARPLVSRILDARPVARRVDGLRTSLVAEPYTLWVLGPPRSAAVGPPARD